MNLYFRFAYLLLRRAVIQTPIGIFDVCETKFRVNPLDLDINLHMNNGRYLSIMDLGRTDLMLRAKIFWKLLRQGYYPVVVSESIRFKKSLEPFQGFEVRSKIESWNEKDFYISQKFICGGQLTAEGYIKGRFRQRGRQGSVPTNEIFEAAGEMYRDSQMTNLANAQNEVERLLGSN